MVVHYFKGEEALHYIPYPKFIFRVKKYNARLLIIFKQICIFYKIIRVIDKGGVNPNSSGI